jgi:hypothetical protein
VIVAVTALLVPDTKGINKTTTPDITEYWIVIVGAVVTPVIVPTKFPEEYTGTPPREVLAAAADVAPVPPSAIEKGASEVRAARAAAFVVASPKTVNLIASTILSHAADIAGPVLLTKFCRGILLSYIINVVSGIQQSGNA